MNYPQVLKLSLSQSHLSGKNAHIFCNWSNSHSTNFSFHLVLITAGWPEAVWIRSLPEAFAHDQRWGNRTPDPLISGQTRVSLGHAGGRKVLIVKSKQQIIKSRTYSTQRRSNYISMHDHRAVTTLFSGEERYQYSRLLHASVCVCVRERERGCV